MSIFQDNNIIISPDPNTVQDFSTVYTITSKVQGKIISAGANKFTEEYTYNGTTTLKVPVVESTILFVSIFGLPAYKFNCTINNTSINDIDQHFDISSNGTQFPKKNNKPIIEYKLNKNIVALDDNKFFNILKK